MSLNMFSVWGALACAIHYTEKVQFMVFFESSALGLINRRPHHMPRTVSDYYVSNYLGSHKNKFFWKIGGLLRNNASS